MTIHVFTCRVCDFGEMNCCLYVYKTRFYSVARKSVTSFSDNQQLKTYYMYMYYWQTADSQMLMCSRIGHRHLLYTSFCVCLIWVNIYYLASWVCNACKWLQTLHRPLDTMRPLHAFQGCKEQKRYIQAEQLKSVFKPGGPSGRCLSAVSVAWSD